MAMSNPRYQSRTEPMGGRRSQVRPEDAKAHLVVHGHFYQPPRENPWTGAVEREPEAHPFHDWNRRITAECYESNAWAQVVDDRGRVMDMLNNYTMLSFNVGPTLISWLQKHTRRLVYDRILAADNAQADNGRRAIAQAFNHTILPLASRRDKATQIHWALKDFESKFRRHPAGLWLPETAINQEVVDVMCEKGVRFTILSPWQVEKVRPLGGGNWRDVSNGTVDPTMPYRVWASDDSGRYLDVFFYDGTVSQELGFGQALSSSRDLVNLFDSVLSRSWHLEGRNPPVVNVAVDGETFGHHKPFGDRTLAYALMEEAPRRGYYVTSYEEYLERYSPSWEAALKPGPGGEGTAWSCAHGVGRWNRDCGCNTGGPPEWNQAWRTPLRQALDTLQESLDTFYEEEGQSILKDVWAARDESVHLFSDGVGNDARRQFMARHASRYLDAEQEARALKLLLLQRMTQFMFTSCGWFFNDISGREAQQVLRYAGKAMDLAGELGARAPEGPFLEMLAEARSNIPEQGNGADVYRRHVARLRTPPRRLAAHHAMTGFCKMEPLTAKEGHYRVTQVALEGEETGFVAMQVGHFLIDDLFTGESFNLATAVLHLGGQHLHCAVGEVKDDTHYATIQRRLTGLLPHTYASEVLREVDQVLGPAFYTLDTLTAEEKGEVLRVLFKPSLERIGNMFSFMYEETRELMEALQEAGMTPPPEYRTMAENTLGSRLEKEIMAQKGSRNMGAYRKAFEIVRSATEQGLKLDKARVEAMFSSILVELAQNLQETQSVERARNLAEFLLLVKKLDLAIALQQVQEELFSMLSKPGHPARREPDLAAVLDQIAERLWIMPAGEKKRD